MRSLSTIVALAIALGFGTCYAEESGWKLPNLNPFKSEKKRTSARVSDDSWMALPKVPTLPGFKSGKSRVRRKEPSTFAKMTEGTKDFFGKTYDVLTPWDNNKPKKPPTHMGVSRRSKSDSGFFDWFGGKEEKKIETVNDFLGQGRPGFDEY